MNGVWGWVEENLGLGGNLDQAVWDFISDPMDATRVENMPQLGEWLDTAWEFIKDPMDFTRVDNWDRTFGTNLSYQSVPEEARTVFEQNITSGDTPYAGSGRTVETLAGRPQAIVDEASRRADWAALMSHTQRGSAARTVVDEAKLQMQQSAIDNALALGMQQLESQYQLMTDELNRQQELASDEIQRARLAALDSMTKMQDDLRQRGSQAQADIMQSIGRTQGSIAAATQEALSRLGSTDAVVSEGIRRSLEEEGQVERGLAASQGDIQADLAARLSQISQGAMDRQRGLVETTAQGSSAELANLVAQINAQRASERSSAEFKLSEDARQQALELMLNPPTKKVGGRAAGKYADQAALIDIARRQGWDPGFTEIMAATGNLDDLLYEQNKPAELTTAMQLAPIAQGLDPEELLQASGTAIVEGRFDDALTLGELAYFVPPGAP